MTGTLSVEMGRAKEAVELEDITIWELEDMRDSFFYKESKKIIDDVLDKVFNNIWWW